MLLQLTDSSLVNLVKQESCIESLTVANNTHVTGLFLTGANPTKLHSLAFYNCFSLQGTVLCAAIETLPVLTTLKLDVGATSLWKIVPLILNKLPKLEELSLSEYSSVEDSSAIVPQGTESLCEAFSKLTELKTLNLSRNIYISNAVLKQVAQSCPKLETLNVSSCNSRKNFPHAGWLFLYLHGSIFYICTRYLLTVYAWLLLENPSTKIVIHKIWSSHCHFSL